MREAAERSQTIGCKTAAGTGFSSLATAAAAVQDRVSPHESLFHFPRLRGARRVRVAPEIHARGGNQGGRVRAGRSARGGGGRDGKRARVAPAGRGGAHAGRPRTGGRETTADVDFARARSLDR